MIGTKWKPGEAVEFKHVVEVGERLEQMSDDSRILGNVWDELQEAKGKVKTLQAELATANGYRAGIAADLRQVEEQSSGLQGELCKVVSLLDEQPARRVLFGPAETDGVAYVVKRRLDRDAARVAELEGESESIDVADRNARRLEDRGDEKTRTIRELEARVAELGTEVARLNAGWHEANGRALEVGLERTKLKAELDARNTCYLCKVTLESSGTPESRVPRCSQCPEPESVPEATNDS